MLDTIIDWKQLFTKRKSRGSVSNRVLCTLFLPLVALKVRLRHISFFIFLTITLCFVTSLEHALSKYFQVNTFNIVRIIVVTDQKERRL